MTGWQRFARIMLVGAAAVVAVALVILVRMVLEPPRRPAKHAGGSGEVMPLTDVAAQPRRFSSEMQNYEPGLSPGRPAPGALPPPPPPIPPGQPGGETAGPGAPAPQWTEPLATPGPPRPPDPFKEPEMVQDPDRGRPVAAP